MRLLAFIELVDEDLRFDRRADWKAAQMADLLSSTRRDYTDELDSLIRGKEVSIVFPSTFMPGIDRIRESETVITVDGATNWLVKKGIEPDIVVTDLDGITVFPKNSIYVVLLHGDNFSNLYKIQYMEKAVLSVQVFPKGRPKFIGGFTDGDRAVALAVRFGAKRVRLLNFDTSEISPLSKPEGYPLIIKKKLAKMRWAEIAVELLESCRDTEILKIV